MADSFVAEKLLAVKILCIGNINYADLVRQTGIVDTCISVQADRLQNRT